MVHHLFSYSYFLCGRDKEVTKILNKMKQKQKKSEKLKKNSLVNNSRDMINHVKRRKWLK